MDGSDGSHVLGFLAGLRSRWSESSMRHAASDLRPLFRWLGRDDLADAIGLAGIRRTHAIAVLLQCLLGGFGSVFPQCGLMVFPGVVIVSR